MGRALIDKGWRRPLMTISLSIAACLSWLLKGRRDSLSRASCRNNVTLCYLSRSIFLEKDTRRRNLPAASTATTITCKVTSISTLVAAIFTSSAKVHRLFSCWLLEVWGILTLNDLVESGHHHHLRYCHDHVLTSQWTALLLLFFHIWFFHRAHEQNLPHR